MSNVLAIRPWKCGGCGHVVRLATNCWACQCPQSMGRGLTQDELRDLGPIVPKESPEITHAKPLMIVSPSEPDEPNIIRGGPALHRGEKCNGCNRLIVNVGNGWAIGLVLKDGATTRLDLLCNRCEGILLSKWLQSWQKNRALGQEGGEPQGFAGPLTKAK